MCGKALEVITGGFAMRVVVLERVRGCGLGDVG